MGADNAFGETNFNPDLAMADSEYKFLDAIPEGWHVIDSTTTPNGYMMISNGESLFSGKREIALVKEDSNVKK